MFESRHRLYRRLCSVVSTTSSRNDYAIKLFTILKRNDPNYSKRTWLKNEHGKCMVSTKYAKKISFQPQIIPNYILYQPLHAMIQCKLYESFLNESQIILVSFYTFRFDMPHSCNCNFAIGDENMIMPNGTLPGNIPLI